MRSLSTVLCTAAFIATSTLGASAAETTMMTNNAMKLTSAMGTLNGVLVGANGVKLDCAGTTAEIHADGKPLPAVPTTSNGSGGCAYSAKVPFNAALTSCAGVVKLGEANERLSLVSTSARTFSNGHEKLGTFGKNSLFSTVGSAKLSPGSAPASVSVTVGAEP